MNKFSIPLDNDSMPGLTSIVLANFLFHFLRFFFFFVIYSLAYNLEKLYGKSFSSRFRDKRRSNLVVHHVWKNETVFLLSADCHGDLQEFGYETTRPFSADRKSKLQSLVVD